MRREKRLRKGSCVVIPVYKTELSRQEIDSINTIKKHFPEQRSIFFIAPEGLNTVQYNKYGYRVVSFASKWFKSTDSYSKLMLNSDFYKRDEFSQYESMIICQTDVLLLKDWDDEIEHIVKKYDYVGAPWPGGVTIWCRAFKGLSLVKSLLKSQHCYVGNGGLSARNIDKSIKLLNKYKRIAKTWNAGEDCFFAYYGITNSIGYVVATAEDASRFALEKNSREEIRKGNIPWGIHAWETYYPEIIDEYRF